MFFSFHFGIRSDPDPWKKMSDPHPCMFYIFAWGVASMWPLKAQTKIISRCTKPTSIFVGSEESYCCRGPDHNSTFLQLYQTEQQTCFSRLGSFIFQFINSFIYSSIRLFFHSFTTAKFLTLLLIIYLFINSSNNNRSTFLHL